MAKLFRTALTVILKSVRAALHTKSELVIGKIAMAAAPSIGRGYIEPDPVVTNGVSCMWQVPKTVSDFCVFNFDLLRPLAHRWLAARTCT